MFVKLGFMPDGVGIVSRGVPSAEPDAAVDAVTTRPAAGPREAIAGIKAGLRHGETSDAAGRLKETQR